MNFIDNLAKLTPIIRYSVIQPQKIGVELKNHNFLQLYPYKFRSFHQKTYFCQSLFIKLITKKSINYE